MAPVTHKQLSPDIERRIQQLWSRYPAENVAKALCLPLLTMAQEQFGAVDDEVVHLVAKRLGLPPSHVFGVVTFYTMFTRKQLGRFHLQVCTNIGCMLEGGYEVFEHCKRRLGIDNKGTTSDGNVTLTEVECLAACGYGPVAQISEKSQPDIPLYFEKLDRERVDKLLDALARGRVPEELGV